jgi:hypothetical protein
MPERVGNQGLGDGHGCITVRRSDRDDADDLVRHVRTDDAGGPASGACERRWPTASEGPYGIDARAHEVGLPWRADHPTRARRFGTRPATATMQSGGYARASCASGGGGGGGGVSRVPRIADDVIAGPCPCQLRAGGLCAVRGKAPLDLPWRGWPPGLPYGGATRVYGGSARRQGHRCRFCRAAAAGRNLANSGGRLPLCVPDNDAPGCGWHGPARSRLTALAVSAGHMPGLGRQAGAAASFRLRNADWPARAVLACSGDRSPFGGCTTTSGDRVPRTR